MTKKDGMRFAEGAGEALARLDSEMARDGAIDKNRGEIKNGYAAIRGSIYRILGMKSHILDARAKKWKRGFPQYFVVPSHWLMEIPLIVEDVIRGINKVRESGKVIDFKVIDDLVTKAAEVSRKRLYSAEMANKGTADELKKFRMSSDYRPNWWGKSIPKIPKLKPVKPVPSERIKEIMRRKKVVESIDLKVKITPMIKIMEREKELLRLRGEILKLGPSFQGKITLEEEKTLVGVIEKLLSEV